MKILGKGKKFKYKRNNKMIKMENFITNEERKLI